MGLFILPFLPQSSRSRGQINGISIWRTTVFPSDVPFLFTYISSNGHCCDILTAIIIMPLISTSGNKKRRWYLQNGTPPWESVTLKRIQGLLWIKCLPLSTECSRKTKNCYCISCLRGKESLSEGEDAFWRQPVESHGFAKAGKDYWDHHVQVSAQDHHAH